MKYWKYFIMSFILLISVNVYAATSNFEPTINMEPDITENQISIIIGYKGENIMALTQNIAYERNYLTLIDVTTMDNFVVTKGNEQTAGNFQTIKLLADSDYSFEDINYAVLTFELKDKFKVGKSSKIFMYTYEAIGPNKDKYRNKGYEMTLRRDEAGQMAFLLKGIDNSTKREYWLSQNYLIIIAVILVIGGIVATIFLIPTKRKKEKRAEKIREELNGNKQNDNKQKDVAPIKIDYDMIEDLGTVKKEVDMSQAIEVSDLKPFGEAEAKYTENVSNTQGASGENLEQQVNTMMNYQPNNMAQDMNSAPIDAFSMTIDNNPSSIQTNNLSGQTENANNNLQNAGAVQTTNVGMQEIPEKKEEDLVLFQPKFEEENQNGNNNTNITSFVLLLILALSLIIPNVQALEYRVDELRDCIVGNIPYNKELDYNNDGKIDVADIIETKDLTNTTLESDKPAHNFKPVEGEGVHMTEPTEPTTTEKTTKFNINTTTKRLTTKNVTTKKVTTKKTTTKKTTTTKAPVQTFNVSINNNHSSVDRKSVSVAKGKSAIFKVTPNVGYAYDSVNCSNGASVTYNKTSKRLEVKGVAANTSCTINFKERDDMKVTFTASHGKVSPSSVKGAYKTSVSSKITPSNGYQYKSHSCTNGLSASYDKESGELVVKSLTNDGSCKVIFEEKTFNMTVKAAGIEKKFTAKYNASTDYTIEVNKTFKKLRCNGLKKVFKTEDLGNGSYKYVFTYKMAKDTVCEYS